MFRAFKAFLGITIVAGLLACVIPASADTALEASAQAGDAAAQTQLGLHYMHGDGGYDKDSMRPA